VIIRNSPLLSHSNDDDSGDDDYDGSDDDGDDDDTIRHT